MLLGRQRMRCKLQVKFDFPNFYLSNFLISQIKITVLIFPHISKFSKISRRKNLDPMVHTSLFFTLDNSKWWPYSNATNQAYGYSSKQTLLSGWLKEMPGACMVMLTG